MNLHKVIVVTFVAIFLLAGLVSAEWKSLDDSRAPANLKVKVLSSTSHSVKVEVLIPGYHIEKVMVEGKECVMINIPGASYLMEQGFPMVPRLSKLVQIHERCDIKLNVVSKEEVEVALPAPIVPSKGHLNRNIDPESVPFEFGPIYKEDVFWPEAKNQFTIGKAFIMRDVRGVRLEILPILANHVQMKMKVLKKAVVELVCEGSSEENTLMQTREPVKHSRTFRTMYNDAFLNYTPTEETTRAGTMPDANNKKLVVVVPTTLKDGIADWVAWKQKCGYTVTIKEISASDTASKIKSDLQIIYDDVAKKFGYLVLIGDAVGSSNFETAQPMPTFKGSYEGAAADRVYVRLAGNDNYPDAFVSRVSDTTVDGIRNQLAKIIAYESNPPTGDWFTKGICIASDQGSPTDKERAEWLQNGGGSTQKVPIDAGGLIKYGIGTFDDIYDPSASASAVTNAVNNGRAIICYIGHGSATSWGTTGFSVTNVKNLNNGGMLPVIWSVACVNGQFVHNAECFGEAWLRKTNGGAAAMECASTNESWVPPCDKQAATVNAIIRKSHFTFGALETVGVYKGLEVWSDGNSTEGNKMAEQCNLFGDCTMLVRTKKPAAISLTFNRGLDNNFLFQIASEEIAQANATVTVYTEDMSFVATADTDESGNANVSLEGMPANAKLLYTVVGPDLIPEVDKTIE